MKTTTKPKTPRTKRVTVATSKEKVTNTTLCKLRDRLERMMSHLSSDDVENANFKQVLLQGKNSLMLSASNEELFISFTIEKRGGIA